MGCGPVQDGLGRVARSRDDGPSLTPHFPASGFGHRIRCIFQRITEKTYNPTRGMTMSNYFIKRVKQTRALTLPFPEVFLVDSLLQLFPSAVQSLATPTGTRADHRPSHRSVVSTGTGPSPEEGTS
jgi:hypothetical protein